jgi:hypothetical protein
MKFRPIAALVLLTLLQQSSLASSVAKTFKGTPEQVFAAAEKSLREDFRVLSVEPNPQELKINFGGPRSSGLEHYSAFSGVASISRSATFGGKCVLTVSVNDVRISSASSYAESIHFATAHASEKNFANAILRRIKRILGQ